jgi:hypothetical protein
VPKVLQAKIITNMMRENLIGKPKKFAIGKLTIMLIIEAKTVFTQKLFLRECFP